MRHEILASELVRALRAKRSQVALSRRLKYKTNAVYKWEAGKDFPMAARFFQMAKAVKVDLDAVLVGFQRRNPAWLTSIDLTRSEGVAEWLDHLRGSTTVVSLAKRTGFSRYAISRWLKGKSEIRLDQMIALIEASTFRVLDFIAEMVDPASLPEARDVWRDLQATRQAAQGAPWTQGVLRALELVDYKSTPKHSNYWIAERLSISEEEVAVSMKVLEATAQVKKRGKHFAPTRSLTVDTRRDEAATRAQRAFWTELALSRLKGGTSGVFSYNVFGVSEKDLIRLRELHSAYFTQMRSIIAASEPTERVVLSCTQLFALDQ